ncbi:MAG: type II toxin-antitoxin system RelE/ParE family toxin [Oceanicaulis sp.]
MEIIRLTTFDRSARKAKITECEIDALIRALIEAPKAGDVIRGTGGLRKVRFAAGGKGKSGGARAIYVVKRVSGRLFLIAAYRKARQEELTPDQKKVFARMAEMLK